MDIVRDLFLILHFLGLAALIGGAVVQMKGPRRVINPAILHGALTQLVTGIVLTGLAEMRAATSDFEVNHMKIGIKALVIVVIGVLVLLQRKKDNVAAGVFFTIFGLSILNVVIAVVL